MCLPSFEIPEYEKIGRDERMGVGVGVGMRGGANENNIFMSDYINIHNFEWIRLWTIF